MVRCGLGAVVNEASLLGTIHRICSFVTPNTISLIIVIFKINHIYIIHNILKIKIKIIISIICSIIIEHSFL